MFWPCQPVQMAGTGRSMLLSLLLFAVTLSLLEMYWGWFAASELKTIAGGFVSSLLFLLLLTRTCFDADPSVVIAFEDDEDTAGDVGLGGGFHHYHIVVTYQFHDGVWAVESFCSCCRCSFHSLGGTRQIGLLVSYFRHNAYSKLILLNP